MILQRTILFSAICLFVGCQGSNYSDLGMVTGKVTLDGQPLSNATVEFQPEEGRPSVGITNESGEYSLEFSYQNPGAAIGQHTVRITTEQNTDDQKVPEKLPAKYHKKSELVKEVTAGSNTIDFELSSS